MTGTVFAMGEHDDDDRDAPEETNEDEQPADGAAVRVAHFSPDAPNVDVYVDGDQVLSDLAYNDVSPYLEIAPGTYSVQVTAAGDPETVAFEGEVAFGQAFYTIAAIGELEAETFRPLVLVDAGASLLRVVHASPDAPAVDVYAAGGEAPLFSNLSFGEESNYLPLPAGSYSLEVRPAGEEPVETPEEEPAEEPEEEPAEEPEEEPADPEDDGDDEEGVEDDYDDDEGVEEVDEEAAEEPADADEEAPTDAVATLEADLEEGMAHSAYAIGYLEPMNGEDRAFEVTVTTDGPMAEEEPVEEEPAEEPEEDPVEEPEEEEEPVEEEPAEEPEEEEDPVEEEPAEEDEAADPDTKEDDNDSSC